MAGYDGYSMSNNARMAYQGGYKPLSSGSRNHPKKTMVTATGTVRGNWFYLDNGGKKRTDGNWFKLLRRI